MKMHIENVGLNIQMNKPKKIIRAYLIDMDSINFLR